jgi:hypothetical protein
VGDMRAEVGVVHVSNFGSGRRALRMEGRSRGVPVSPIPEDTAAMVQPFQVTTTISPNVFGSVRKAFQCKQLFEYMHIHKTSSATKTYIPTDSNNKIMVLKSIFYRAMRDIACRILDFSVVNSTSIPASVSTKSTMTSPSNFFLIFLSNRTTLSNI